MKVIIVQTVGLGFGSEIEVYKYSQKRIRQLIKNQIMFEKRYDKEIENEDDIFEMLNDDNDINELCIVTEEYAIHYEVHDVEE